MGKRALVTDDRQGMIPIDLPPAPRQSSDLRARDELLSIIEKLEAAQSPPWSVRLLEWQRRRVAALVQLLTPLEGAALALRFEAELARLGEPEEGEID